MRPLLLVLALLVLCNPVSLSTTEKGEEEENDLFTNRISNFLSVGAEYWSRLGLGFSFETYDDRKLDEVTENPDAKLNLTELVKKYDFPIETHNVYTDDDYVLTLHRIPHGRRQVETGSNNASRPVVLLHHGFCSSSVDWVMNTVDKALPYMLADSGFDVWLANARGNKFSNRHIRMTSKRSEYWDFSWHEIGEYDLPTVIDYILAQTNQAKLDYVGHSMGTTVFFVTMSIKPEYNAKIRQMFALAPGVFMEEMTSPLRYLARFSTVEKFIFDLLGNGELLPSSVLKYIHRYAPEACVSSDSFTAEICDNVMYAIGGYNPEQMNATQMPVILSHTPSTGSTKSGIHFLQSVSSGQFRQYDHGIIGNLRKYKQFSPPDYPLEKVSTPVTIFWAENDLLCHPNGIKKLVEELPNVVASVKVNSTKFTHIDFLFAKDADKLVYQHILKSIKQKV